VVIEPGRTFRQVARNKIESLVMVGHWAERGERFVANPVFDGNRLYIRGEGHLYAIGPKPASAVRIAEAATTPVAPKTGGKAPRSAAPTPDPVLPEDSAPLPYGWRRNGSGLFAGTTPPIEWSEKKNLRWRADVGKGHSSPVVVGDRVIVVSEPDTLHCLNRTDGALLWKAKIGGDLAAAKEWARPTPVSDGLNLYLSLGDGTVASYTLEGKRRWAQSVEPAALGYGSSASPVLVGDLLLVDAKRMKALEAETGKLRWTAADSESHYGTPAILSLGGTAFAVTAKGSVVRVSDGALLAREIAEGLGGDQAPSPVVRGDVVYFAYKRCSAVKLSYTEGRLKHQKLWEQELPGDVIASPVVKDGLLHVVPFSSPDFRVLDAKTGAVLLEKELDIDPNVYPSLALAGGWLYVGNDEGAMLVLDPGRDYKEVRRNRLPKGSGASPAFSGAHLFLRGGDFLYCIGP
jgi:outer membrane protein assembly factor BamB